MRLMLSEIPLIYMLMLGMKEGEGEATGITLVGFLLLVTMEIVLVNGDYFSYHNPKMLEK